jgi:hypothetical protein
MCRSRRWGSFADPVMQRTAGDELHHHEDFVVGGFDVVDGRDVGMVERGGRLRFLNEALLVIGVANVGGVEEFERDRALESGVNRFVDDAHAAFAELLDNSVVRDRATDHERLRITPCISWGEPSIET